MQGSGVMQEIVTALIGNGALGAILAWFMWQHQILIKDLKEIVKSNTTTVTTMTTAIQQNTESVRKCSK